MPAHRKVDREEFARLHAAGLTQKELADHFGIARSGVIRHSAQLGLTRRPHAATSEQLALWESLIDDGWSFSEIARTHHVATDTLRRYFPGRAWTPQQGPEMAHAWRQLNSPKLTKNYAHQEKRVA
ncbi:hypothetical protein [Arthrobacter sp. Z1-15]